MELALQIAVNGILAAAPYGLIAGGLSFLYATTRIFHLAHGAVVVAGGYAFWWAWMKLGWPSWAAALGALSVSTILGVLMSELVYEALRKKGTRGLGYLIATLALLMLGTAIVLGLFGAAPKTFSLETDSHVIGGVIVTTLQVWIVGISALLLGLFYWVIRFTKLGKAMRATADNEIVAEVLGIDTKRVRRYAFALSSFLAGAAGVLIGLEFNLDPNMGVLLAVKGFAAAVIGGVGSFGGAIVGSLIIGLFEQAIVWFGGSGWRNAGTFVILFLFLLFKPSGLFGSRRET